MDTKHTPLSADLGDLFATLHDIPDDVRASALQSSEIMQKNRELEDSGQRETDAQAQEREDRNQLARRSNMVSKFFEPDRKLALYKLKKMAVGEYLVVHMVDANNLRVACSYQRTNFDKAFITNRFEYNKRAYLEIKRVE
jgi:hypothetical protein